MHNITSKKQHVQQKGIQFDGVLKAGYELAYNYSSEKPHQIANIVDDNYRTEGTDAKDVTKKDHKYEYDNNGNLVYVNTERPKKDGTQTPKSTERKLLWDEENRLQAIDDNGFVSNYWYDAAGERTVKTSGESQQMYVNSVFSGGDTQTANFTAYVNAYLVVSKGGQYTKNIYIGSQRIVSKLGDLDSYGSDPRRIEYAGANVDGAKVDYADKYKALQQTIKDRYAAFEVEYYGKDNDDYVNGQGFCCDDSKTLKSFAANANDNPELFQYYYHSDHLGSTSLITNLDGEVVQHIEYVPFGEVFIEERNNTWNTPYLFNAKELDEETGLYYYGARYYDPRVSIWISTDPLQEKYPNVSSYAYCRNNPVIFVDVSGTDTYLIIYGSGWLNPNLKGLKNDTGDGFKKNAEAMKANIQKRATFSENDKVVIVYATTEEEYINALNTEYESGKIKELNVYSHGTNNSINLGGPIDGPSESTEADADYRLVSAFKSGQNPGGENEIKQINAENFTDDAIATLWGCNLGGSKSTDEPSHAKAMISHLGEGRTVNAFVGGGGAEFKIYKNLPVFDGTMIRSADRASQKTKLTQFKLVNNNESND